MTDAHKYPYPHDDTSAATVARAWVTCSGQNTHEETQVILRGQASGDLAADIKASWQLPRSCTVADLAHQLRILQGEYGVKVK